MTGMSDKAHEDKYYTSKYISKGVDLLAYNKL